MAETVRLGEITCPSGELVLMDGGYLGLWSGARSPEQLDLPDAVPSVDFEVVDFRPHSHHWQVMADVRASAHQAATIEVGAARVMFAMTSVGDGFFPVHIEHDASGKPTTIRITIDYDGA